MYENLNCIQTYSTAKRRGAFLSPLGLMIGIGVLFSYCLGAVLYWRYVAFVPPILYILLAIYMLFLPESPLWLLGHKGEDDSKKALQWLR